MGISLVKIGETRWTKSCDVPFFFVTTKFHTSQHPMKTVFKLTDALEKVSTRSPASNTDDTTIKFQYSFMSVSKFHDLANNGTRTVLASSIVLMHTHTHTHAHNLSSITTVDKAKCMTTIWY
jgi:hypothetical protein